MASLKEKHEAFIREIRSPLTEETVCEPHSKTRRNRKHLSTDSSDIQDVIDIQRELEKKFDELFGCEDD